MKPRRSDGTRWFRRHPKVALALLIAMFIVLIDIATGSALHAFGLQPIGGTLESSYRVRHPVYHHTLRPSTTTRGTWGASTYRIRTDKHGFKSASVASTTKHRRRRRVLLMGDSFTEGVGLEHEDTFAGILSSHALLGDVEILNGAVVSYSPVIYLRKVEHLVEHEALKIDEVIVFIDMSDITDEALSYSLDENRNVVREADSALEHGFKSFIRDRTVLMNSLRRIIHDARNGAPRESQLSRLNRPRCLWESDALWNAYGKRGLASATRHMDDLRAFLNQHKIRLTIAVYPWPDQIVRRDLNCLQARHWRDWSAKRNVGFIDMFPVFIGATSSDWVLDQCFIPGDVHWNRSGHERVANRIAQHLRE